MTLTARALTPWLRTVSMTSFCTEASPEVGLRKSSSTPSSSAALLAPASAMVQNDSGLLVTNATLGLPEPLQPAAAARREAAATQARTRRRFMVPTRDARTVRRGHLP